MCVCCVAFIILTDISVCRATYCGAAELYLSKDTRKMDKIKTVVYFYLQRHSGCVFAIWEKLHLKLQIGIFWVVFYILQTFQGNPTTLLQTGRDG